MRAGAWSYKQILGLALLLGTGYAQEAPSLFAAEVLIEKERFPEAERMLEALRASDGSTEVVFRLAYVQFRQRKLESARRHFDSIVKTAPPAFNSRYFLGRIALMENRAAEAITWLEPVAASRQTIYDAASQLAAAYQSAGQPRRVIAPLLDAIQQAPWDGALHYRLGRAYQQLGKPELAREALSTAGRLKNSSAADVEVLMTMSRAIEQGQTAEAANLGRKITERADADPAALVALGLVWVRSGMPSAAIDAFERAAAKDGNYFAAQFNLGLSLLRAGRSSEAFAPLTRAVRLLPQSFDANLTLGLAAVIQQRYTDALPSLEAARRLDTSNIRVTTLLATANLRIGHAAEALRLLRQAGPSAGQELSWHLMFLEALNATDNIEEALEAARRVQQRFPQDASAQMALAQQLARVGHYQEAGPVFEKVLALDPGQPEASLGLADVRQKRGDHAGAIEAYRVALDYRSTTLAARLGAARSLAGLKRFEEARQLLEAGLASHASEPTLRLELSRIYARLGLTDLAAREAQVVNQLKAEKSKP